MKLITPLLSVFLFLISTTQTVAQDWLIERSEWGSTDSLVESNRHTIEYITIHHGGEIFEDEKTYIPISKICNHGVVLLAAGWMCPIIIS